MASFHNQCFEHGRLVLEALFATIRFVHVEGFQCVRWERGMCGRLIKNKKSLLVWVSCLENLNCIFHLSEELLAVPPCVSVRAWINNFMSIASN